MHLQILKENLLGGVGLASRFVASKAQLPVLTYMAIRVEAEGIYLMGSDLSKGIRVRVAGKVIEKGEFAVPAKLLLELVQQLPLGVVELVVEKQQLKVTAGKTRAVIQGVGLEDFPVIGEKAEEATVLGNYKVKDWNWVLERLQYAISKDDARPVLTGVLWKGDEGVLAATDGYRLSVIEGKIEMDKKAGFKRPLLVPGTLLKEAVKVMDDSNQETFGVSFLEKSGEIYFIAEDGMVMGRVMEGEYPQYEAIVPDKFRMETEIGVEEFLAAVRTAAIFARESANIVNMSFAEGKLTVRANAPQVGENVVEVEIEQITGEGGEIAFNAQYLIDYLASLKAGKIRFLMNEELQPGMFLEGGKKMFRHVIMPVRVRKDK